MKSESGFSFAIASQPFEETSILWHSVWSWPSYGGAEIEFDFDRQCFLFFKMHDICENLRSKVMKIMTKMHDWTTG